MENQLTILSESLDKKLEVLQKIREYNKRQEEIFSAEKVDMSLFDDAVEEKQRLIDEVVRLDEGFEILYEKLAKELEGNRQRYAAQIREQIQKGNQAITDASGKGAATVRLPGGCKNATVIANVDAPIVLWSIDTLDWKTRNAQKSIEAVIGHVKDGDIVLMHELYNASGDAAVAIIPKLVEQGYQLVTVSELAQYRGGMENGKIYYSFPRQ